MKKLKGEGGTWETRGVSLKNKGKWSIKWQFEFEILFFIAALKISKQKNERRERERERSNCDISWQRV